MMQRDQIINSYIDRVIKPIEEWVGYQINDKGIPVIGITITNTKETLYTKVLHHKDLITPIPSINHSLFNVGSVSKLMTYIALLQLVEQGKVNLEDPITKYMPPHIAANFAPKNPVDCDPSKPQDLYRQITVFNLIRHTSGLIREPLEGNYFADVQCSLESLVESMGRTTLVYCPNETYKYSNAAVSMAGYVIQFVSGMTFEDYVQQYVLDPIGMSHCTFKDIWNETRVSKDDEMRLCVGHMWRYWDETSSDLTVFKEAPLTHFGMNAAGGAKCNLTEINNFLRVFLNRGAPLLKERTFQFMITPQPLNGPVKEPNTDYRYHESTMTHGLGVEINQMYGLLMARHGGAINGFASEFRVLPEIGVGIYICTTLDCCNSISSQLAEFAFQKIISNYYQPSPQTPYNPLLLTNAHMQSVATLKSGPIPVDIRDQAMGIYRLEGGQSSKDLHRFKVYQEYNQQVYIRTTFISKIGWVKPEDSVPIYPQGYLVSNDRLSFGNPLPLYTSADGKKTAIGQFLRDDNISNNNLFFQPYIPLPPVSKPPQDIAPHLKNIIGHYSTRDQTAIIFEDDDTIMICIEWFFIYTLSFVSQEKDRITLKFTSDSLYNDERVVFFIDSTTGKPTRMELSGIPSQYHRVGPVPGQRQHGVCSLEEGKKILEQSYSVPCPHPQPASHSLVDLGKLSPTLLTDVKYAGTDNFLEIPLYKVAKAYLHRQAAESLLRAHQWLEQWGLGLIIYDSYRPWNVTWAMSESVCPEFRGLYVADPKKGSVHNRGGAVDLTLYDLKTGSIIPMQGEYDELSIRSHRSYFGGTSRQRWYKKLLTTAMMNNDFIPYEEEWWHFDYKIKFDVLNIPIENL